jgi:hypothetical protein
VLVIAAAAGKGGRLLGKRESGSEVSEGENCKNPPDLRLGLQKTTRFEEIFKNPPVFTMTVATGADQPD